MIANFTIVKMDFNVEKTIVPVQYYHSKSILFFDNTEKKTTAATPLNFDN